MAFFAPISCTRIVQSFEDFASKLVQQEDFSNITVIAEETVLQAQSVSYNAHIKDSSIRAVNVVLHQPYRFPLRNCKLLAFPLLFLQVYLMVCHA